jgi:predicted DNA-binding transcriptional regulator YafY
MAWNVGGRWYLAGVNRTDRLYALVEELRAMAPRPRSARQLAKDYEVSTRTIERDIVALQESGVPVYAVTVCAVEPVAFAGTRAHWCLLAWCRLRDGARAFRVDRIVAAADTGEPAPHRSYADMDVGIPQALVRVLDLAG